MGSVLVHTYDVDYPNLFPNWLLVSVIALGFVEVNLAALLGAWHYKKA